jgi:hypothetical protein
MDLHAAAIRMLADEARSLMARLARIRPFALQVPAVAAATVSPEAFQAIDRYLMGGRSRLRSQILEFLGWAENQVEPELVQRRLSFLRLRFNAILSQLDIFADAVVQRSEHRHGVELAGLDALAADALKLPSDLPASPPVISYLDRGAGAAIRRARTRLPGGGDSPVAVIRVPRERMISSGIASSMVHEAGHQGAAILDLVVSLRQAVQERLTGEDPMGPWRYWERWISEMVADLWSVAKVGVTSTLGLIGVVSLPRAFVFRIALDDPHAFPWIRVKLSCAMGNALYPHRQWTEIDRFWEAFYPTRGPDSQKRTLMQDLESGLPEIVELLLSHRPPSLRGRSLAEVLSTEDLRPERLRSLFQLWQREPARIRQTAPCLVFAVIGQARWDSALSAEAETRILGDLLEFWALQRALPGKQKKEKTNHE